MTLESEILALLPLWMGYCVGSFITGFGIGYLWTYFAKLTEKI